MSECVCVDVGLAAGKQETGWKSLLPSYCFDVDKQDIYHYNRLMGSDTCLCVRVSLSSFGGEGDPAYQYYCLTCSAFSFFSFLDPGAQDRQEAG